MSEKSTITYRSRYHSWLPANPCIHRAFLERHVYGVTLKAPTAWNDWASVFIDTIQKSDVMRPLLDLIFKQVNKDDKWLVVGEKYRVQDVEHLRLALTSVTQSAPEVYVAKNEQGEPVGEPIAISISLVLDLLSNTGAAYDLFRLKEFNAAMEILLNKWGGYLADTNAQVPSNSTLNETDSGWFGPYSLNTLESGLHGQSFYQTYGVEPAQAQQHYLSWDQFFVRSFANIAVNRPIIQVDRFPVIYNACESTSLRIAYNVKLDDTFWLKDQQYSLYDIFGGNVEINPNTLSDYAPRFVGGTVYQAFLSFRDYHRWHSPVKGTIIEARRLPGTYYAVLPDDGAPADDPDMQPGNPHGAIVRSQPWLTTAATRGVIIIQPDEPSQLEWVAVIAIGMVEVSTIDLRVSSDGSGGKPNHVEAGDELGMFHFGGSSHALVIKPKDGYQVEFKDLNDIAITPNQHRWVRSIIGRVVAA